MLRPWVVALAAAILTAGCTGGNASLKGAHASTTAIPSTAPSATHSAETCGLQGIVTDDEAQPVAGASVNLLFEPYATTSAQDGSYSFSNLPAKKYTVVVAKEGYEAILAIVSCVADTVARVPDFVLAPEPAGPFMMRWEVRRGTIGCSVSVLGAPLGDSCANPFLVPGANATANQVFAAPGGNVTGFVAELTWETNSVLGPQVVQFTFPRPQDATKVNLTCNGFCSGSNTNNYAGGQSPVRLEGRAMTNVSIYDVATGGQNQRYSIRTGGPQSLTDPAHYHVADAAIFTKFDFHLTYFYNGYAIPDGYTHLA